MTDEVLHEKIEAYILKRLPPREMLAFETQIKADPALARQVDIQRFSLLALDRLGELELRKSFANWRNEMDAEASNSITFKYQKQIKFLTAAILFILVATIFFLWWRYEILLHREREERANIEQGLEETQSLMKLLQNTVDSLSATKGNNESVVSTTSKQPLYLALAEARLLAYNKEIAAKIGILREVPTPDSNQKSISQSYDALNAQQYNTAENLLIQFDSTNKEYWNAREMLAYVYFKSKKYTLAVDTYKEYMVNDNNIDKTNWYLCLFYLGDYPRYRIEFQTLLQKIIDTSNRPVYQNKAKDLRQKMAESRLWPY